MKNEYLFFNLTDFDIKSHLFNFQYHITKWEINHFDLF